MAVEQLRNGVNRLGRIASQKAKKKYGASKLGAKGKPAPVPAKKAAPKASSRWYQTEDAPKPLTVRKKNPSCAKLRSNITPGTVLILLAGRFRGKRVVFLKQLDSGLLLISGPFKINGVNVRRVNQAYVISTSTKVDVSKVDVSKVTDATFARVAKPAAEKGEDFFKAPKKATETSAERKALQKSVDTALLAAVKKVPELSAYLNAKFTLTKNDQPHLMKF
eukprot:CAMPEP_0175103102 /NCGR_PEP_ID=MMETSP0086_2-20121207/8866_1 /TAXON_ID=136419 /ORGANISM="Unknown Unknown, Strain D1" /LENGTH=220 /DNA_ID=CAMNT_0016378107 /DNA_START=35 /DNA_END=697 /DNA_ORIENTATION=+